MHMFDGWKATNEFVTLPAIPDNISIIHLYHVHYAIANHLERSNFVYFIFSKSYHVLLQFLKLYKVLHYSISSYDHRSLINSLLINC